MKSENRHLGTEPEFLHLLSAIAIGESIIKYVGTVIDIEFPKRFSMEA